jgi:hypothetical protein
VDSLDFLDAVDTIDKKTETKENYSIKRNNSINSINRK